MIAGWYMDYLYHRSVRANLKGCTYVGFVHNGTPQGGVLSPIIWNLEFNPVLTQSDRQPEESEGFADDLEMTVCGKDPVTMVSQMQVAIRRAEGWAIGRGLAFSVAKMQVVIFHRKKKPLAFPPCS